MLEWKRRKKYRGAEVIAGDGACGAARSLANLRLLAADVPPLPLKNCDRPATRECNGASTIGVGLSDSIRDRRPLDLLAAHEVDNAPVVVEHWRHAVTPYNPRHQPDS